MRTKMRITHLFCGIALVALLLAPGFAAAANDAYICYAANSTISTDPLTKCSAALREQLSSFTVGGIMPAPVSSGTGGGGAVIPQFTTLTIKKTVSQLSTNLLTPFNKEQPIKTLVISIESTDASNITKPVITILLQNAYVLNWNWASDADAFFIENYTLAFSKITILDNASSEVVTWSVPTGS